MGQEREIPLSPGQVPSALETSWSIGGLEGEDPSTRMPGHFFCLFLEKKPRVLMPVLEPNPIRDGSTWTAVDCLKHPRTKISAVQSPGLGAAKADVGKTLPHVTSSNSAADSKDRTQSRRTTGE